MKENDYFILFQNGKRILSTTNKAFEGKSFHQYTLGLLLSIMHPSEIQIILSICFTYF